MLDLLWTRCEDGSFITEMSELQRDRRRPDGTALTDVDLNGLEPWFVDGELKWLEGELLDGSTVKIFND